MESVRSHRNKTVVEAARLHRAGARSETGLTLIEGPHLLQEAIRSGFLPRLVLASPDDRVTADKCREHGLDLVTVSAAALSRVAGTKTPRGPVSVVEIPSPMEPKGGGLLIAWSVGDPGNVGTMIRTAAAFGWDFGITPGTADPWSPKVLRAGAGAQFRTSIAQFDSVDDVTAAGWESVAMVVAAGSPLKGLSGGPFAVLIGDEAHGLPHDVAVRCSHRVTIPMPGDVESLNAAAAAAIAVYTLTRVSTL